MKTLFDDEFGEIPVSKTELKISSKDKKLSKEQIAFNRLVDRIQKLEKAVVTEREQLDYLFGYYEKEVSPHQKRLAEQQIALAFELNELSNRFKLSRKTLDQISDLIVYMCDKAFEFIAVTPEIEELYDQWSEIPYKDELENQKLIAKEMFSSFMEASFGKSMDFEGLDLDDPESVAKFQAKMKHLLGDDSENQSKTKAKKKSKKEIEAENKAKAEELIKNKSIRSIYISLSKMLHPDMETDETKKLEKLEQMKVVTAAYEQKDLSTLLRLEMEYVFKTTEHLESLADEKLKIYTSILKERAADLEREKSIQLNNPKYQNIYHFVGFKMNKSLIFINEERNQLIDYINFVKYDIEKVAELSDKKQAKQFVEEMFESEIEDEFDNEFFF